MGYERETYYFDCEGQMSHSQSSNSVLEVTSVEHDVYGNPSYSASIIDIKGAKEALPILRQARPYKEYAAIQDALRNG